MNNKKILCYASPPPNGERYRQRVGGEQAALPDKHYPQSRQFAGAYPLSGARCVGWLHDCRTRESKQDTAAHSQKSWRIN